jgi:perosamine synthetase
MVEVPFFRPDLGEDEIAEVVETLRSGWLTTGPRTARFEKEFAEAVGARYALAVNSCTAAMHLALEALELRSDQAVLIPTMTFAATAEVVRYLGAVPVLVDCEPETLNLSFEDAERKLEALEAGELPVPGRPRVVGIVPVHVGGRMIDPEATDAFARRHGLWVVEDAAHSFPAAFRSRPGDPWRRCGEGTAKVSCFSFYANKTITTGEGGMATSDDERLLARMRSMSLHGLSHDAWGRYTRKGSWDYRILAPGFKYNLTDIASAIGLHQLAKAETMRAEREAIAERYREAIAEIPELLPPPEDERVLNSWHLFQARLVPGALTIDRDTFLQELRRRGIGFSVHWRPLHLHPYYAEPDGDPEAGWRPEHLPTASEVWRHTVSLPIFPGMREEEISAVITALREICSASRA